VSGTLTLLSHSIRRQAIVSGSYTDPRNRETAYAPIESIATSSGQNDSGLFELNFRDDRYLPFEGAGAVSRWNFRLPATFRAFDYDTINDVILHLRYTARDGGGPLASQVNATLEAGLGRVAADSVTTRPLAQLISLRHELPTAWASLVSAAPTATQVELTIDASRFPYLCRTPSYVIGLTAVDIFGVVKDPTAGGPATLDLRVMNLPRAPAAGDPGTKPIALASAMDGLVVHGQFALSTNPTLDGDKRWLISVPNADGLKDLFLLISYQLTPKPAAAA
jgi:hypothetical protein